MYKMKVVLVFVLNLFLINLVRIMFMLNLMALMFLVRKFLWIFFSLIICSFGIGSPYTCNVFSSDFTFENYEYAPINKRTLFLIKSKPNSKFSSNMYVEIISPSNNCTEGKIEEKSLNIYGIRYTPTEVGDHQIIFYNDKDKTCTITKFVCQVYDSTKIRISDLPPAVPHQIYTFTSKKIFLENSHFSKSFCTI